MTKKKYHIITIGCAMNFSDSERMSSFLDDLGYAETRQRSKADLVIINTCGVKQTSESRVYGLVPQLKKDNEGVKIVITGCVSGRPDVQRRMKQVDLWLPIKDMTKLAEFLDSAQGQLPDSYLKIAPKYNSRISAQVPIGTGCDNFCSYCVVPYARGREVYRSSAEIVSEVRDLVARGYKEINLIAQNVNSFKDGEVNFAQLLKSVNCIEGNFWIRFVSSHPKDMSEELIKTIAECGKCCHHIHLPVQAGDDEVLARMNRKYTVEHYRNLLVLIRSYLPDVSITTDIIVGFPGETDEQFEHTADLAEWARFDNIYIGKYSQRPYTAAAKFKDDVIRLEKKRREEALMDIMRRTAAENHQKYLGQTTEILVEQFSKGNFFGRTRDNTFVKISSKDIGSDLVGQIVTVRITEARDFGMDGELIA
jgi:tRNA-2-methylthio-N6-dimethylallyladenosine synthase